MPLPPVYPDVWLRRPVQLWSLDKVSDELPECVCDVCVPLCVCVSVHSCPGPVQLAGSAVLLGLVRRERELHLSLSVPSPQTSSW